MKATKFSVKVGKRTVGSFPTYAQARAYAELVSIHHSNVKIVCEEHDE